MKYILLIVFIPFFSITQAQVIPDSMRVDWSHAGYEGTIPDPQNVIDVTLYGALPGDNSDDVAAVISAMNALNGNLGVLYFPAGTYNFNTTLYLTDSVVLRGAGSDSTILHFDFANAGGDGIRIWKSQTGTYVDVLSGFQKGFSKVVVSDASSFLPGDFAEIKETNGAWNTVPVSWAVDCVGQIAKIINITGDTLFLDEALRITYDAALQPQIRVYTPITTVGIECLKIVRADTVAPIVSYNLSYYGAENCWVKGVESDHSIGAHILADLSSHLQIMGCYIHHAYEYDGISTHGYGVTLIQHTGDCLVTNNFFKHLRHAMMVKQGANGNVFSYNYSIEPTRTEVPNNGSGDMSVHGHYPFANLFEGNIGQTIYIDQTWGPGGPYNTFFRNRADLYGIIVTNGTVNTNKNNFVGTEITNTNFLYGLYLITGLGHFLWGNNLQGTIDPVGTNSLADVSYYLSAPPDFWYAWIPFPSLGIPNTIGSGTIPARERYNAGGTLTQCGPVIVTGLNNIYGDKENALTVYPNPFSNEIKISFSPSLKKGSFKMALFDLQGRKINYQPVSSAPNEYEISIPATLSSGCYLLKVMSDEFTRVVKVVKE